MSNLCKIFGHSKKRLGITTTPPPDVRLAKIFECRRCQTRWVHPDGHRNPIPSTDSDGLKAAGIPAGPNGATIRRVGRVIAPTPE